jgi:hypothetical protein
MNHRQSNRRPSRRQARLNQCLEMNDSGYMSMGQYVSLCCMAAAGRLTVEQINELVDSHPHLKQSDRDVFDNLKRIVAGAQASQQSAIQATEHLLVAPWHPNGALAEAARNAKSDEARLEIADIAWDVGRQSLDGTRTIERMNQDNNNVWRWIGGSAVAIAGIAAITAFAILFIANDRTGSD